MGADLYIPKVRDPIKAEWQPKFDAAVQRRNAAAEGSPEFEAAQNDVSEAYDKLYGAGYFRDPYNGSSVLWRLGLSWWQDLEPDIEDEDSEVNVSAERCREFLDKVKSAELKHITEAELRANHCLVDDGENSVEKWNRMYAEKRDRLIEFLETAIDNGGMYASL